MDEQNRNLILASVLSFIVIIVWFVMFPPPEPPVTDTAADTTVQASTPATLPAAGEVQTADVSDIADVPRIAIDTPRVSGSISLAGGRLDELFLKDYREELAAESDQVQLLRPIGEMDAYYAAYGWIAASGASADQVPTPDTIWSLEGDATLGVDSPVTLIWDNGAGLVFRRTISIDENYMFKIDQNVSNTSGSDVELRPYGLIRRHGEPSTLENFFILHEGLISKADGELVEDKYKALRGYDFDDRENALAVRTEVEENGWIGFTDHFWMTTLIPSTGERFRTTAKYYEKQDIYQSEVVMARQVIPSGTQTTVTSQFFAGAKEWDTIRNYEKAGVVGFLDSIDWGWFFFITKPMFAVLHWLNVWIGNMGWAIIGLTLLIKAALFPLAYKSYVSMAKMKELQPEMAKLKERCGDDRQRLQKETMELYKKEKVNPAAGCLPILLQIPIFFSLYKVIFVTLELRHAPWIGWIKDLSAPDPSSILNLFGLFNYATPGPESIFSIVSLGILPILLGISMWLQQKLNPAPTDATQAMIFAWMPWVFMFMLGTFASGLVIYWIANNMITFSQQYLIMRTQGYKPDVFGNIIASFKRKDTPSAK